MAAFAFFVAAVAVTLVVIAWMGRKVSARSLWQGDPFYLLAPAAAKLLR
jgi:hypothetical protein